MYTARTYFFSSYFHFTCSKAGVVVKRSAGEGLKESLRSHASTQAAGAIISESGIRHLPKSELQDQTQNLNNKICCFD